MGHENELWVVRLGTRRWRDVAELQERARELRLAGAVPDLLLLCEHPPTYTRGRRRDRAEDLPLPDAHYRAQGIEVEDAPRGGHVTYHGPGQLVGYPIMRADRPADFVHTMQDVLVAALRERGVAGARSRWEEGPAFTGVWVGERKIGSIGIHVSRGVTSHGFAVNVANDVEPFHRVVACGLPGTQMTSMALELGDTCPADPVDCLARTTAHRFAGAHGLRQRLVSPARAGLDGAVATVL